MIETALPPIRKMMERAASSRSTRPRNSKSAEASNLAGMPFVEGPERILSHVHEEPPSPGHRRRPVLGEFPVEVVPGAEEVTRLARRAPPTSRLLAEFLEAGERCRQFRQHSEECQRALSPRAVFQLAPVELSPRPSQHDRKRAQEGSISARETEREGKSCLRSEAPVRSPAAQRSAQSDQRLRRCLPVVGLLGGIHRGSIVSLSPAAVELAEEPCMTVLRRTCLDGSWHVLDGRPQREARFLGGAERD